MRRFANYYDPSLDIFGTLVYPKLDALSARMEALPAFRDADFD